MYISVSECARVHRRLAGKFFSRIPVKITDTGWYTITEEYILAFRFVYQGDDFFLVAWVFPRFSLSESCDFEWVNKCVQEEHTQSFYPTILFIEDEGRGGFITQRYLYLHPDISFAEIRSFIKNAAEAASGDCEALKKIFTYSKQAYEDQPVGFEQYFIGIPEGVAWKPWDGVIDIADILPHRMPSGDECRALIGQDMVLVHPDEGADVIGLISSQYTHWISEDAYEDEDDNAVAQWCNEWNKKHVGTRMTYTDKAGYLEFLVDFLQPAYRSFSPRCVRDFFEAATRNIEEALAYTKTLEYHTDMPETDEFGYAPVHFDQTCFVRGYLEGVALIITHGGEVPYMQVSFYPRKKLCTDEEVFSFINTVNASKEIFFLSYHPLFRGQLAFTITHHIFETTTVQDIFAFIQKNHILSLYEDFLDRYELHNRPPIEIDDVDNYVDSVYVPPLEQDSFYLFGSYPYEPVRKEVLGSIVEKMGYQYKEVDTSATHYSVSIDNTLLIQVTKERYLHISAREEHNTHITNEDCIIFNTHNPHLYTSIKKDGENTILECTMHQDLYHGSNPMHIESILTYGIKETQEKLRTLKAKDA